jgi:uncharacterized protein involved in cysteine biosynthesis
MNLLMKTTVPHRAPPPAAAPGTAPPMHTLRLGLIVSAVAAVIAVLVEAVVDVPIVLILIPVVVIGFALSWHVTGRRDDRHRPPL